MAWDESARGKGTDDLKLMPSESGAAYDACYRLLLEVCSASLVEVTTSGEVNRNWASRFPKE